MKTRLTLGLAVALALFVSCNNNSQKTNEDKKSDTITMNSAVEIFDPAAELIVSPDARFEVLAEGFYWSEGPLWIEELQSVIFSDVPANKIYRWNEKDGLSVYLESSGHSGAENVKSNRGSNGLILNAKGDLLLCQHGDRRIAEMKPEVKNPDSDFLTIAESYDGKKFNSPNDLVMDNEGNIYFTDPPYGLPENKTGEIGINGVFKVSPDKVVTLLIDSLTRPNGIGLSPDQKTLYINQSDPQNPILLRYDILDDGMLSNGSVLFDYSAFAEKAIGLPDGLKVHKNGNIFATGPGGVHIINPEGGHLGLIKTEKATANCAFDRNYTYLYTTTTDQLMRIQLK
ncbi:MAG: gluconolactonase [Marinilabiliales bacterium]|nr:MAG: gluconolactonase [Marinilabiliales bacterium]